jgi:exosortase
MPALTSLASAVESKPDRHRAIRLDLISGGLFLAALWFILCRHLSGEWTFNEQYNYGWFVPFFALLLLWLRWETRPRESRKEKVESRKLAIAIAAVALALLLPIRLFEIGNPDWRPLGWIHAASVVTLTLLIIWYAGGNPWLRHFAFPVAFFFVAVPWITPIEVPIIQGLMRSVAAGATETIALLGIPAQLEGNLIRIHNGLVGVNEACSGVRSLQTSLMIGLLFGELKRLSIWRRLGLIAGAIAIALIANFCRAVFLVWIAAAKSIPEVDRWHDIAGYTIVGLVFVGTLGLASLLSRSKVESRKAKVENETAPHRGESVFRSSFLLPNFYFLISALIWIALVEIGAASWYRAHERDLVTSVRWEVRWPENAPGFHETKITQDVRRILRFDRGRAASWKWSLESSPETPQPAGRTMTCSLFFFRWDPGQNSALIANLHRPDVCLPAVGWTQVADTGVKHYRVASELALPFRHFEFRHGTTENPTQQTAHAFYCLWEDRAAAGSKLPQMAMSPSAWTRSERVRAVMEGRRHLGQQVMEFVVLTRSPVDLDQVNARFAEALPELIKVESRK